MGTMSVYIGWDPREQEAYDVAEFSLLRRSSISVQAHQLSLTSVKGILTRPIERYGTKLWCPISNAPMSTEFAISRFCVPHLQKEGWALFVDCDVLFCSDVKELFDKADPKYAVMVVKHQQQVHDRKKMDDQIQTVYPRKNWSSVVLWNCSHPSNKKLTFEVLNTWKGRDLHAFKWLQDDEIGELPREWNYLAEAKPEPKIVHYTLGTPNLPGYENCEFSDRWRAARTEMKACNHGVMDLNF